MIENKIPEYVENELCYKKALQYTKKEYIERAYDHEEYKRQKTTIGIWVLIYSIALIFIGIAIGNIIWT